VQRLSARVVDVVTKTWIPACPRSSFWILVFDGTWRPLASPVSSNEVVFWFRRAWVLLGFVWLALNYACLQPDKALYTADCGLLWRTLEFTTMHNPGLAQFIPGTSRFSRPDVAFRPSPIATRSLERNLKAFLVYNYFSLCRSTLTAPLWNWFMSRFVLYVFLFHATFRVCAFFFQATLGRITRVSLLGRANAFCFMRRPVLFCPL